VAMVSSSSSDRWLRLEALFYEAGELKPEARAEFLDRSCGADVELRKEVETLLQSAEKAAGLSGKAGARSRPAGGGRQPSRDHNPWGPLNTLRNRFQAGSGRVGEVYLAEDMRLRRKVAIKVLAPELTRDERGLRRFEQEAHAASALNHPSILTIHEFGQADGLHFIASEFIEGETLRQCLSNGRLELNTAIDIAIQMASALAAAHTCGIVHRDVKPDNVIVRNDGIVKVLDFGIAKLSEKRVGGTIRRLGEALHLVGNDVAFRKGF
jgi:tRNA A-37 threonylcarbamoyl transferase component Bud32